MSVFNGVMVLQTFIRRITIKVETIETIIAELKELRDMESCPVAKKALDKKLRKAKNFSKWLSRYHADCVWVEECRSRHSTNSAIIALLV
jgi:hypothetical protein